MSMDYAILGVISAQPCTGYDIKSEFDHEGQGLIWGISHGSIYTRLRELEKGGLVFTCDEETNGRQRKVYDLTPAGWKALIDWQAEPPEYPVVKDDLLLKVSYWANADDRDTLIQHLQVRKARSMHLFRRFEAWTNKEDASVGEYGGLTIQYVCMKLKAELDWIDMAIAQLQGPSRGPVQDLHGLIPARVARMKAALGQLDNRDSI